MSGIANKAEQMKDKFLHSGEPGSHGRENFEDSTGPAGGFTGQHAHSDNHGLGASGTNTGLTGTGTNTGLTGTQGTGAGLTGNHATGTGLTGDHTTGTGLTGNHGANTGLTGNHSAGTGLTGSNTTGTGFTGNQHGLSSESTARSDLGHTSTSTHGHHDNNKPGMMDKVKDALGGNKDHNTSSTGSPLHTVSGGENTTSTGLTGSSGHAAGQGIGGHHNAATGNTAAALGAGTAGHHNTSGLGHTGSGLGNTGSGLGNTGSGLSDHDRVGGLDQRAHNYESTGATGPTTSGAAGTDRFDTGKHHSTTSGITGATHGGLHEGEGRAEKGTGGVGGLLTTTDKDFLGNRERMADSGAYQDTDKHFRNNTSGPGGNSALTGREGTTAVNPVAQAQSRGADVGPTAGHQSGLSHGTDGTGVHEQHLDEHGNPKKPGLMDKIKNAIS